MKLVWGTRRRAVGLLLVAAVAGCTKLIDHGKVGCNTDKDCEKYSLYHPFCQQKVCVESQLAPKNCFYSPTDGVPTTPENFLNQCSKGFLPGGPEEEAGGCLTDPRDPNTYDAGITMPPTRNSAPASTSMRPSVYCKDLAPAGATVIYMSGSSNFQPLLAELAPAIVDATHVYPVFRTTTSCSGAHSMNMKSRTYATDHWIKDPAAANEAYAQIFLGDAAGGMNCLLGTDGVPVDVGESEIYPESCEGDPNPPELVEENLGPILPLVFIVPQGSNERAISFETARQVFGNGGGVKPWLDPMRIFVRGNGTATLRLLAKELELTPAQVWGIDQGNAFAMAENVGGTTDPVAVQSTIGIIGTDIYDLYPGRLKPLAFQAKGQSCAYVPDSKLAKHDKINVRDGHYPLWGRIHFYTQLANGVPVSQLAHNFVFQLTSVNLDPEIFEAFVHAGFVPTCAMKVKRTGELSNLVFDDPPPHACGCAFDMLTSDKKEAPEGCKTCTNNGDCPENQYCNFKFCEKTF